MVQYTGAFTGARHEVGGFNPCFLAIGLEQFLRYLVHVFRLDQGDDATAEAAARHAGAVNGRSGRNAVTKGNQSIHLRTGNFIIIAQGGMAAAHGYAGFIPVAAGEGIPAYAQWMRKFDTTITELSGNLIFPLLMNSLADVSGVLWERCVTFWGPETVIEQETRITAMLAEGRGRDAALYIENIYHYYCDAHPNE